MSSAWCFIWTFQWEFMEELRTETLSRVISQIALSMIVSTSAVAVLTLLEFVGQWRDLNVKVLSPITAAIGLLVGITWENTFHTATDGLAEAIERHHDYLQGFSFILLLSLFMLSAPAWQWYILPRTSHHLEAFGRWRQMVYSSSEEELNEDEEDKEEDESSADED